jgi:hypothetical protein
VSRAFPSWNRSILTEIYLYHACSYHEIDDGIARPGLAELPAFRMSHSILAAVGVSGSFALAQAAYGESNTRLPCPAQLTSTRAPLLN